MLKNNLVKDPDRIGPGLGYDHKHTSTFSLLILSLAVLLNQEVLTYLYFLILIMIVKDTVKSGVDHGEAHINNVVFRPLIYYLAAGSIIIVAALTTGHTIPSFQSSLLHYIGVIL